MENKDINFKAVMISGIGLTLIIFVGLILSFVTFVYFEHQEKKNQKPVPLMDIGNPIPPEPRLQVTSGGDLQKMREEDARLLNEYAWIDQKAGIARIPVERAMEILAEPDKEQQK